MVRILILILMLAVPCHAIDLDQDSNDVLDTQFGGPNVAPGTDPDVNTTAEYSIDTDDFSIRGYDGSNQFVYGHKNKSVQFALTNPDDLPTHGGRATQSLEIYYNDTGFSFIIVSIRAMSDTDNYDFNLYESASSTDISTGTDTLIDSIECDTNGTSGYYDVEISISHSTINADRYIIFEHVSGTSGNVHITITGYLDADVP